MADIQGAGYAGFQQVESDGSDLNAMTFLIEQIIGKLAITMLVKVIAVRIPAPGSSQAGAGVGQTTTITTGGTAPVQAAGPPVVTGPAIGFVDVQPMVHQVDDAGNTTPHDTINNLPYMRIQGGVAAIVVDPVVGDKGVALFCTRDISVVKATGDFAGPGSRRRNDWADGLYIGGFLNSVPSEYIQVSPQGINLVTTKQFTIEAPNITLDAGGNLGVLGEVTAKVGANSVKLSTHEQKNVTAGTGLSGPPQPGT